MQARTSIPSSQILLQGYAKFALHAISLVERCDSEGMWGCFQSIAGMVSAKADAASIDTPATKIAPVTLP